MRKFITRGYADGTDFIGTDKFRGSKERAGRKGFGDMICEVSNLVAKTDKADILCPFLHAGHERFMKMIDMKGKRYFWNTNSSEHAHYITMSNDNKTLCDFSGRELLFPYPDHDYVKLDESKFVEHVVVSGEYITTQSMGFAKKCEYHRKHIQEAFTQLKESYGLPIVEVGGMEKLGMEKIAYIIKNSKKFVGIDSGMTHFANCIKEKNDVVILVPKDRITGVSYRWINNGYDVRLV